MLDTGNSASETPDCPHKVALAKRSKRGLLLGEGRTRQIRRKNEKARAEMKGSCSRTKGLQKMQRKTEEGNFIGRTKECSDRRRNAGPRWKCLLRRGGSPRDGELKSNDKLKRTVTSEESGYHHEKEG